MLILISMPLAFQLGMSAFLFAHVQSTQRKIEAELERKSIVATLDKIHHLHVRCLAAAAFYSINRDEEIGRRHIAMLKDMSFELRRLRQQTENNPELLNRTNQLQRSILAVVPYEMLMRKLSLMEDKPQINQSQRARDLINDSMRQLEDFQSTLMPPADDIDALRTEAAEQLLTMGALLVFIVSLAMILLVWLQKNILEILDLLLNQIKRFRAGNTIKPVLTTGDEMAELELVVCESALRIAGLENLRRELCSIVSHDVRAPMTSIGGLITLLESGAFGELNCEEEKLVCQQRMISSDLLAVLNNILDLDKLRSGKWSFTIEEVACSCLLDRLCEDLRSAGFSSNENGNASGIGTFKCDPEALGRAVTALVWAHAGEVSATSIEVFPNQLRVLVKNAAPPASASHRRRTATALSELFCERQNLKLRVVDTNHEIRFDMEPGAESVLHVAGSSAPSGRSFSKIGRRFQTLISTPMAICAGSVLLYGILFNQFAHDIGRELVSREIVHRATSITSGITQLMLLSIRRVPGELKEEEGVRERVKLRLDDDLNALRLLEAKSGLSKPEALQLVSRKISDAKDLSDSLSSGNLSDLPSMMKRLADKEGALSSIAFSRAGSLLSEQEAEDVSTRAMSELRANVIYLLLGASLLTILFTIYSAWSIVREFIGRLHNAADNARKLAARETLRKPQEGADEIADLDAFFYQVASEIDKLEREQKVLSGLLREQLKLPLSQLDESFKNLLALNGSLSSKGRTRIQRTLVEIRRLSDLVDDLLLLDSLREGGRLDVDVTLSEAGIDEIVNRSIDAVSPQAELKGISIERKGDFSLRVMADGSRSVQILVNLLSNAVKFSPENGTVCVSIALDQSMVRIAVQDHGRGIPQSERHKIFSRYEQIESSDSTKGSGLGLFISKKLAETQLGDLSFESTGQGTTFNLALPAVHRLVAPLDDEIGKDAGGKGENSG